MRQDVDETLAVSHVELLRRASRHGDFGPGQRSNRAWKRLS
jgi:hypothetical protein